VGEGRAAAPRPPRRIPTWAGATRGAGLAVAVGAVIGAALVPVVVILGSGDSDDGGVAQERMQLDPVGTVIPKGQGNPPREADSTVVATGATPVGGPWQLEIHRSSGVKGPKGEVYLRAGGACLILVSLDPPDPMGPRAGGYCSPNQKLGLRKTPGFSRQQHSVTRGGLAPESRRLKVAEVLIFGVVPERASAVVVTTRGGKTIKVEPEEGPAKSGRRDYYLMVVDPSLRHGRINWLDRDGNEGSRGVALLPPLG
jgi:hypothetical protein